MPCYRHWPQTVHHRQGSSVLFLYIIHCKLLRNCAFFFLACIEGCCVYSFVSLDGDQKRALGSPVTGVPWLLGTLLESWGVSYFTFLIKWALHPCGCFFLRSAIKYGANCSSCMFLLGAYACQLLIRCRSLFWMCSKDWTWQQVPVPPDSFFNSASVQSVNPNTIPSGFSTNKDLVHIFRIFTDCFTPELGWTISG